MKLTSYDVIKTYEQVFGLSGWYNPSALALDESIRLTNLPAWETQNGLFVILEKGWSYSPIRKEFTLTVGDSKYTVTHIKSTWVVGKPGVSKGIICQDALEAFREVRACVQDKRDAYDNDGMTITEAILYGFVEDLGACKWVVVKDIDDASSTCDYHYAAVNRILIWVTRAGEPYSVRESWDLGIEKMRFTRTLYGFKAIVETDPYHSDPIFWRVSIIDRSGKEVWNTVDKFEYIDEAIARIESALSNIALERARKDLVEARDGLNSVLSSIEEILNKKE